MAAPAGAPRSAVRRALTRMGRHTRRVRTGAHSLQPCVLKPTGAMAREPTARRRHRQGGRVSNKAAGPPSTLKIVVAPNAFKDCLSAVDVGAAMARGIWRALGKERVDVATVPLADGGDGTLELMVEAKHGRYVKLKACDALMRPVESRYGIVCHEHTARAACPAGCEQRMAVIELADASGIARLKDHERLASATSSFGFGEQIRHAVEVEKVKRIMLCIGGSASNDGGMGLACALGYRFLDKSGGELKGIGANLGSIERIDSAQVPLAALRQVEFTVACDVENPLLGEAGATAVYGPQKGLRAGDEERLESGLARLAMLMRRQAPFPVDVESPGAGAAGGVGAGLMAFCGAKIVSGFDLVAQHMQFRETLAGASLVITGEGRIDDSTAAGKVPFGVTREAWRQRIHTIAVAGSIDGELKALRRQGLSGAFCIASGPITLEESKRRGSSLIEGTVFNAVSVWSCALPLHSSL